MAGEYSSFPTGIKNITIECHNNGSLKKYIIWSVFYNTKNNNNTYKTFEQLHRTDGTREKLISYHSNGNIWYERLYYKDGTIKAYNTYYSNGNKYNELFYRTDGIQRKFIVYNKDEEVTSYHDEAGENCNPKTIKCVASDPN